MEKIAPLYCLCRGNKLKHFDVTNRTGKMLKKRKVFEAESQTMTAPF